MCNCKNQNGLTGLSSISRFVSRELDWEDVNSITRSEYHQGADVDTAQSAKDAAVNGWVYIPSDNSKDNGNTAVYWIVGGVALGFLVYLIAS
jgi:hypothetical protein